MKVCLPVFLAALFLFVQRVDATKPTEDWKTGKLLSYDAHENTSTDSTTTRGTLNDDGTYNSRTEVSESTSVDCTIVIDDGKMLYFGVETLVFRWQHSPKFTENEVVQFSLAGDRLVVIDDAGKRVKLHVFKRRIKE